jgi:ACS family glucarate transporter-like MFS transporter
MARVRVRHSVFALILAFSFSGYVQRTGLSVAAQRMMPELGFTQIQIGWLFTAFLVAYSIFQVPGAVFGERVGARRALAVIGLATCVGSVATAAAPWFATGAVLLGALLAARAVLGVAQAALFPVAAGTLRNWFPVRQWATGLGLMVTGFWLGAALTPPAVAWLMERRGWQAALLITSVPWLAFPALWWWVVRDRPSGHPRVGAEELAELAANPPAGAGAAVSWARVRALLADRQLLLLTLSYFLMNYVFYLVTFWCFLFLVQERRLTVLESGWLATLPFLVAGVAATAGGRIADRFGLRLLPRTALPASALFLYLTVALESPGLSIAALCLGFAMIELNEGAFWAVAMRRAPNDAMSATAMLNTGGNLGGVVATPIIAALSAGGGWMTIFVTGAVLALAASALWIWIDPEAR